MKKISVIVPVYNVEAYLEKCLNSLVKQTIKEDYEIIVVNDGSPDNSDKIIESFEKKYPKLVRGYKKVNGGLSSARNYGISKAKGKYLAFVDSDDYVDKNYLKYMYEKAIKDNSDIVICDIYEESENGLKVLSGRIGRNNNILNDILISFPAAWNKLYKKELFTDNNIEYPLGIYYEDLGTTPRLLMNAKRISYVKKPLYYYLVRLGSITHQTKYNSKTSNMFTALDIINKYFKENNYDNYRDELEYLYINNLLHTFVLSVYRFKEGKNEVAKAIKLMHKEFPNWKNNKYYKLENIKYKIVCNLIYNKQIWLLKLILR